MGGKKGAAAANSKAKKKRVQQAQNVRAKASSKKLSSTGTFVSLHDELGALGLQIKPVLADGNCFFRAIADQVSGQETSHHDVRFKVVQYMKEHSGDFSPFVEDDEGFDNYITRMQKETTWAGHMEVQAASLCYEANIHIYQSAQPTWRVINFTPIECHRCLHLSYHDGEHYNSNAFGEHQVRMVSENTLCFDKDRITSLLRECGGNVDDATEQLISQMAKLGDAGSTNATSSNNGTHVLRSVDAEHKCRDDTFLQPAVPLGVIRGIDNPGSQQHGNPVSVNLKVHKNRVWVSVMQVQVPAHVQLKEPDNSNSGIPSDDAMTGLVERRPPKRNKALVSLPAEPGSKKPANNKPCPCKSGRRYKRCCKAKHTSAPTSTKSTVSTDRRELVQLETLDI